MKKEAEHHSDDGSGDDTVDVGTPESGPTTAIASVPSPSNPTMSTGTDHFDLLQDSTRDSLAGLGVQTAPDVLITGNGASREHSGSVDLIDFTSEVTPAFVIQGEEKRDSAISTSSSARFDSFSSNRSSGAEFTREITRAKKGHDSITEEDSGFDFTGLEHLDTPDTRFRKRTSEISNDDKRRSTISHRGSTSSGTITGVQGDESNRDSQASFLSFDGVEFPPRSGSSSTADDERELPPMEKKPSRASSLKRRLKVSRKSKEKGSFRGEDDFSEHNKKKEKGFFTKMRKGRSKEKTSKTSGTRVYEKLAEKTLDAFDIANGLPHPEVEVKTTKGLYLVFFD